MGIQSWNLPVELLLRQQVQQNFVGDHEGVCWQAFRDLAFVRDMWEGENISAAKSGTIGEECASII